MPPRKQRNEIAGPARVKLVLGDCLKVMPGMPRGMAHAVVCDPPYGLKFMGKGWDDLDAEGAAAMQAWHRS